jgi:hypothetical protein
MKERKRVGVGPGRKIVVAFEPRFSNASASSASFSAR